MAGRGQRGRGRGQFFHSRQQPPESKSGRGGRGFPPGRVEPSRHGIRLRLVLYRALVVL